MKIPLIITAALVVLGGCEDLTWLHETFTEVDSWPNTVCLDQKTVRCSTPQATCDDLLQFANITTCEQLSGSLSQCSNCYFCDSPSYIPPQDDKTVSKLIISDSSCGKSRYICCIAQTLLVPRTKENCGKMYPEGNPPQLRPSVRSVIEYEYPWRAWIYSYSDDKRPLCGATFVNEMNRALVTSATCIGQRREQDLYVKFSRTSPSRSRVSRVLVHESYNAQNHINDIALLKLNSVDYYDTSRVGQVCYTKMPPMFATPCIAVSKEDYYINTVIPKQEHSHTVSDSLMYAVAPRHDYIPEAGSGLVCLDIDEGRKASEKVRYILYGIALVTNEDQGITNYTNVANLYNWIYHKSGSL